jgi:hypothetical protein
MVGKTARKAQPIVRGLEKKSSEGSHLESHYHALGEKITAT